MGQQVTARGRSAAGSLGKNASIQTQDDRTTLPYRWICWPVVSVYVEQGFSARFMEVKREVK